MHLTQPPLARRVIETLEATTAYRLEQAAREIADSERIVREQTLERAAELAMAGYYRESKRMVASEFENA